MTEWGRQEGSASRSEVCITEVAWRKRPRNSENGVLLRVTS